MFFFLFFFFSQKVRNWTLPVPAIRDIPDEMPDSPDSNLDPESPGGQSNCALADQSGDSTYDDFLSPKDAISDDSPISEQVPALWDQMMHSESESPRNDP